MAIGDIIQLDGFDRYAPGFGGVGKIDSIWNGDWGVSFAYVTGRYFGGKAISFQGGGNSGSQVFRYNNDKLASFVIGSAINPQGRQWNAMYAAMGANLGANLTLGYLSNGRLSITNRHYGAFDYDHRMVSAGGNTIAEGITVDAIVEGVWQYVELSVEILNTTNGNFRVWVNGELCLEALNVPHGGCVVFDGFGVARRNGDGQAFYDDWYVREGPTKLGEIKIETIIPDSTASNTLPVLVGAATAHAAISETVVDGDTSYIQGDTAGQAARFTYGDLTTVPNVIRAVHVRSLARKDETEYRSIKNVVSVDGLDLAGKEHVLGVGYKFQDDIFPLQPNGSAWTKTAVDGFTAGVDLFA